MSVLAATGMIPVAAGRSIFQQLAIGFLLAGRMTELGRREGSPNGAGGFHAGVQLDLG